LFYDVLGSFPDIILLHCEYLQTGKVSFDEGLDEKGFILTD
jgi:hypothetical protein